MKVLETKMIVDGTLEGSSVSSESESESEGSSWNLEDWFLPLSPLEFEPLPLPFEDDERS